MKKISEAVVKVDKNCIADDHIQIMIGYRNYLLLFGNNDLMYFKHFKDSHHSMSKDYINIYFEDERRNKFPYSQIPEHIGRGYFFRKYNFTNQILDFEKPYIVIFDGTIRKMTAFKDGDDAIIHHKLYFELCNKRTGTITREELETYLKTGSLDQLDENQYEETTIFDMNGKLYNPEIELEQKWIEKEKEELLRMIDESIMYQEREKEELQRAISTLDDISPFFLFQRMMIKFKPNGEVKIDAFNIKYLEKGKYQITLEDIPMTMENLSTIKSKFELSTIPTMKPTKISLLLNPNVTKEQVQKERAKYKRK